MIPLEVDGNFTADASGNGTDKRIILSGHWSAVYASCQCAGSGQWVAGKLGRAQFFQQGANVVLGPIILQPGQQAQVTVAGATPGAVASIVYWGWQSDAEDGADLAATVPSLETAGSLSGTVPIPLSGNVGVFNAPGTNLQTAQSQKTLGSATPGSGASGTIGPFPVDPGTHGIGVYLHGALTDWQRIGVYANNNPNESLLTPQQPNRHQMVVPVLSSEVTQVSLTYTRFGTVGTPRVAIAEILDSQVVYTLASRGDDDLPEPFVNPQGAGIFPISLSLAAGASGSILAGVANYYMVIWKVYFELTSTFSGVGDNIDLLDTSGTPNLLASFATEFLGPHEFEGPVIWTPAGVGLQLKNNATAALFPRGYAVVGFSPIGPRGS